MKARCWRCRWLDYDFFNNRYNQYNDYHRCGLHGQHRVDPDGEQLNLDTRGGCGYTQRFIPIQLELKFE